MPKRQLHTLNPPKCIGIVRRFRFGRGLCNWAAASRGHRCPQSSTAEISYRTNDGWSHRTHPDAALGDKPYSSRTNRALLRSPKIEAVISKPSDQQGHRLRRGSIGGPPPKFDTLRYRGRNVAERGYARLKQWRGLGMRYDKLAIVYRVAVVLNGVTALLQL